jgi:hypothetical protein
LFLLIYNMLREASAAILFSAMFPAATVIFQFIPITLLALTFQPSSYRPYKPKPRWMKKLKLGIARLSDRISSKAKYAIERISSQLENVLGKPSRTERRLPVSFVRQYQSYYWTTYNYKRRAALHARWRCLWAVCAMTAARAATAYQCSASTTGGKQARQVRFDSDSYDIMVDNCCSYSITNSLADYITAPTMAHVQVRGYADATSNANKVGTVKWRIEDDAGKVHDLLLPGTYYSPKAEHRMLSPQHWCQKANDHKPNRNGTLCVTQADSVILKWDQLRHTRTIPLTPKTNIGVLRSAPGNQKYNAFCALCEENSVYAFPSTIETTGSSTSTTNVVSDDEEKLTTYVPAATSKEQKADRLQRLKQQFARLRTAARRTGNYDDLHDNIKETSRQDEVLELGIEEDELQRKRSMQIDFNLGEDSTSIPGPTQDATFDDAQLEYQHAHEKLSHAPHSRILQAIKNCTLPAHLAKVKPPPCPACLSGRATRTPWRTRGAYREIIKTTKPGECTSCDQLESTTPGFMGLLKGQPTKRRYKAATVFKDHFSKAKYVYYMEKVTSEETLKAKNAYERWAANQGVQILRYHADNGRFGDRAFMDDCKMKGQRYSYCGVDEHNQNGHAEKSHKRFTGRSANNDVTCTKALAECNYNKPLAICHQHGSRCPQQLTIGRSGGHTAGTIQW